jgi:hypothetical protein
MANIFTLENVENFTELLNIDELYEKKRNQDMTKLELYNKILNRIHVKIKTVSRQKIDEQFCWFLVPEIIIGVPRYDNATCIAYLIDKLKTNKFVVRYIHPNLLFISWMHWVPAYVRTELKKKTGIQINEFGEKLEDDPEKNANEDDNSNNLNNLNDFLKNPENSSANKNKSKKEYTPITSYKPSGNFVYDEDLLNNIKLK